jgi:hypothetical protein
MAVEKDLETRRVDRRALLRKAAAAGAVGWTAPVILTSAPAAAAGVFTAKCAPGNVTATASFVRTACRNNNSDIRITIVFSGPCPCGGAQLWCARKVSPLVTSSTSTIVFTVTTPIGVIVNISGQVALGCTDRDGDRQFAAYNWSMRATDNGNPCSEVVNSISGVMLSNRTLITSATCPLPATLSSSLSSASAEPAIVSSAPAGATRLPEPSP